MSKGVCYLVLGEDVKLPFLVSLHTLRQHFTGPVAVMTDMGAWVKTVDPSLVVVDPLNLPESVRLRLGSLLWVDRRTLQLPFCLSLKAAVGETSPWDSTVYLDADTLIVGSIDDLFLEPGDERIRVTQCADWTTSHVQMQHRFWQLAHQGIIHPGRAKQLMESNAPAINTGVFAVTTRSRVLEEWQITTPALERFFLHDELALQMLLPDYPHDLVDDRWNCLVKFSKRTEDIRIHHCVGALYGMRLEWFDGLRAVWESNLGDVRSWLKCNPKLWSPIA